MEQKQKQDLNNQVQVLTLSARAVIPTKGTPGSAGWDLYAAHDSEIQPNERALIKTNIAVQIPPYLYGRIAPRSGLAYKHGIDILAGVIDSDYRGDIGVILYNTGKEVFVVKPGDRIAQLIFERHEHTATLHQVGAFGEKTMRGDGGYGSTGK